MKINLDTAAPTDHEVVLAGKVYLVPGDIPVEDYIKVVVATDLLESAEGPAALQAAESLYDVILDLFRVRQPKLEKLPIGVTQMVKLVYALYSGVEPQAEEGTPDPTVAAGGTTRRSRTKTPAKKTAKSTS